MSVENGLDNPEALGLETNPWAQFDHPSMYIKAAEAAFSRLDPKIINTAHIRGDLATNYIRLQDKLNAQRHLDDLPDYACTMPYLAALDVGNTALIGRFAGLEDRLDDAPSTQLQVLYGLIGRGINVATNTEKARIGLRTQNSGFPGYDNERMLLLLLEDQAEYSSVASIAANIDNVGAVALGAVCEQLAAGAPTSRQLRHLHARLKRPHKAAYKEAKYRSGQNSYDVTMRYTSIGLRALARHGSRRSEALLSRYDQYMNTKDAQSSAKMPDRPTPNSIYQAIARGDSQAALSIQAAFQATFNAEFRQKFLGGRYDSISLPSTFTAHNIAAERDACEAWRNTHTAQHALGSFAVFSHTLGASLLEYGYSDDSMTTHLSQLHAHVEAQLQILVTDYAAQTKAIENTPVSEGKWQLRDLKGVADEKLKDLFHQTRALSDPAIRLDLYIRMDRLKKKMSLSGQVGLMHSIEREALNDLALCEMHGVYPRYDRRQADEWLAESGYIHRQAPENPQPLVPKQRIRAMLAKMIKVPK